MDNEIHFDSVEDRDNLSVTISGTAVHLNEGPGSFYLRTGNGQSIHIDRELFDAGMKIVRHEKPVVFEPGDVVRHKRMSTQEYVILKDRHKMVSLTNGEVVNLINVPTSESFDRVSVDTL